MNDQIICPHCKKTIPLTQALSHQVQEKYRQFYKKRLEEEKQKIEEMLKDQLTRKIKEQMELQYKDKANEADELYKQNKALQQQLLDLNRFIRQLKTENDRKQLEMEKQLAHEQEKIRQDEKKRLDEEFRFKMLENEKKLQDALKMNEELKRKLEQGSQQTQGEVLEIELEQIVKREFPFDLITPVPKGVRGGDIVQIVKNNYGKACGTIIWESKRTKTWSDGWITKLKEDQRTLKAEVAIIVSDILPQGIQLFGLKDGIWISSYQSIIGLCAALRAGLIDLAAVKTAGVGKEEKKEILWNYLTSIEFRQRVEAIYDSYSQMTNDLKKEKDWFMKKWAKQEKNIQKIAEHILGMHGDLEGIVGKSLPELSGLEMLPEETIIQPKSIEKDTLF